MAVWFIADTHFNHDKIIEYCGRPFKSVDEMNKQLISRWNSVVKEEDIVYHLGDVGFGSIENNKALIGQLKGKKILIVGNHDRRKTNTWWKTVGFSEVYREPTTIVIDGIEVLLSHEPVVGGKVFNIHGHSHNKSIKNKETHLCVSIENINYTPMNIDRLIIALESK